MIKTNKMILILCAILFLGVSAQVQTPCYVCRREDRYVLDPSHAFELTDIYGSTFTMTCGELENTGLNDLLASNSVCGIFLNHADKNCDCGGPPIAPVGVLNENPLCDICGNGAAVPEIRVDELVQTGVAGEMPCGLLYEAASTGFMPAHICPIIVQNVADFCCSIPAFNPDDIGGGFGGNNGGGDNGGGDNGGGDDGGGDDGGSNNTNDPPAPTCGDIHSPCSTEEPCCSAYDCKVRRIGDPPTCSSRRIRQRESIATNERGGAAGRAKFSG